MAPTPLPAALLEQARSHPAHSVARTNLLLEALVVSTLGQPKPRTQRTPRPPATEDTPADA